MSWRHPNEPSETVGTTYDHVNGTLRRREFREGNAMLSTDLFPFVRGDCRGQGVLAPHKGVASRTLN